MPEPTLEAWAQIRYAYEHTDRTVEDICAEHGTSSATLRDRMRRWHWTRRRPPIPRDGPPAVAIVVANDFSPPATAPTPEPSPPGKGEQAEVAPQALPSVAIAAPADPALIVQRLQGAVARVLPAIEAIIARLAAGPHHPREMEQAGRALGALMRTLRELNALLAQHNALAAEARGPMDIDAFREELARRIHALIDEEEANAQET